MTEKVLITKSKLDNLATTIGAKSGATLPLTIPQMQAAVNSISTGGSGDANVIETIKVNNIALTPDANKAVNISVPTVVADLSDSADYITYLNLPVQVDEIVKGSINKIVALLFISNGQASIYLAQSPMTFSQFYNAYQCVGDVACLHMISQYQGYVYEPIEVDATTSTVKLQSIYNNIIHTIVVTDSGNGLIGTYTETTLPSLQPIDVPITKLTVSGVTINTLNVTQYGNLVEVDMYLTLTGALSTQTTIATGLPTPFRYPIRTQSNLFGANYGRPLRVLVEQDGSVDIRYGAADTYYLSFTYLSTNATTIVDADEIAY